MKYLFTVCVAVFALAACNNKNTNKAYQEDLEVIERNNEDVPQEYDNDYRAENDYRMDIDSLGYYGVYEGAHFGEDARTMKAKLVLYDNNRYVIESVDIDADHATAQEEGTYLIFGDLLTLTPDNNGVERYYRTDKEHMTQLDNDKKELSAYHSNDFRLYRK